MNMASSVPYLGKHHALNLVFGRAGVIEAREDEIVVPVPFPEQGYDHSKYIDTRLNQWGRMKAIEILKDRISFYEAVMGVQSSQLRIKSVKTLWGSCNSKGRVMFNWRLVMAPIPVIDYVVVHELAHLIHRNHSEKFWKTVESVIPDYKQRRKWLRLNEKSMTW
ncbi:MAG: M48 family metallopeptidase [Candidatus Omnitrophica bacterium]|nr:M48 family metallopeptidase [Candidatus Omnitrophota bacterium]